MASTIRSHRFAAACSALAMLASGPNVPAQDDARADLIVVNAQITTLDETRPEAKALAVRKGSLVAVGDGQTILRLRGDATRVIDAGGRRLIPGLNDSHLHAVRGGRFYNLELRWDGVDSLERGLAMINEQAKRTPQGQWVRVIGGWSPYQFREKRLPTTAELNQAAPGTPVFVLFLYSQGLLNQAGVEALRLFTTGSAWFSGEETVKGKIAPGQYADFAILSADYVTVPDEQIRGIESLLTVTGGDVVYAAKPFTPWAPPPLPPVSPTWSPVATYGGYQQSSGAKRAGN